VVEAEAARFFLSTEDTAARLGFADSVLNYHTGLGFVNSHSLALGGSILGIGLVAVSVVFSQLSTADNRILVRHEEPSKWFPIVYTG
jgi:hypothetical protein